MPSIDERAVKFVLEFEKKRGWKPTDVSRKRSSIGYDILSTHANEIRAIEVKGTRKEYAIPDAAETEFTRNLTLVATHLYIIGNMDNPNAKPVLYIIPRKDIKREHLTIKQTIHFRSTFQKQLPKKYKART
jgi:hypothetical protein